MNFTPTDVLFLPVQAIGQIYFVLPMNSILSATLSGVDILGDGRIEFYMTYQGLVNVQGQPINPLNLAHQPTQVPVDAVLRIYADIIEDSAINQAFDINNPVRQADFDQQIQAYNNPMAGPSPVLARSDFQHYGYKRRSRR